jgi:N-acetyl-anhydromuramyl-L-alanine amidase AmpD
MRCFTHVSGKFNLKEMMPFEQFVPCALIDSTQASSHSVIQRQKEIVAYGRKNKAFDASSVAWTGLQTPWLILLPFINAT